MNLLRAFILSFLIIVTMTHMAHASSGKDTVILGQEGVSIQMDVKAGFDGRFLPYAITPLWVKIHNGGEKILRGQLIIRTRNWIPPAIYTHDVEVPPGKTETYKMFFYEQMASDISVVLKNSTKETILEKKAKLFMSDSKHDVLILCLSEQTGDFEIFDDVSVPGHRSFVYMPRNITNDLSNEFRISHINIARTVPPQLMDYLSAWDSICAVYCDFRSYLNLDYELKRHLQAWVELGGELLLYPPEVKLSSDEIQKFKDDPFLPFEIRRIEKLNPDVFDPENLLDRKTEIPLYRFSHKKSAIDYCLEGSDIPLFSSIVTGWGGITLLGFHPDRMNPDNLKTWVELLFQLGCLVPSPYRFNTERDFTGIIFRSFASGSHIPSQEARTIKGIWWIIMRHAFKTGFPLLIILAVSFLFFKLKKHLLFLYLVLPILVLVSILYPQFMVRENPFQIRPFEAYHLLQLTSVENMADSVSTFIIGKPYPEKGKLKIECPAGYSTYDEIIKNFHLPQPLLTVDCGRFGQATTEEKSIEDFRIVDSSMEINSVGSLDGFIHVDTDGLVSYEITNNTGLNLTNCEIYPYGRHIIRTPLPRMLPDIAAGETIKGHLDTPHDDNKIDNERMEWFNHQMKEGILSYPSRDELFFGLEAFSSNRAYKLNRPYYAYHSTALFYAFTSDFAKNLKINGEDSSGFEITLVQNRFDVIHENDLNLTHRENISTLLKASGYQFKQYDSGKVPNLEWMIIDDEFSKNADIIVK